MTTPVTPKRPVWIALLGGLLSGVAVTGFMLTWLWPLGQFGSWNTHWPYLHDGLLHLLSVSRGADWARYQTHLARQGALNELYARLMLLTVIALSTGLLVYGKMRKPGIGEDAHIRGLQYIADTQLAAKWASRQAKAEQRQDNSTGVSVHPAVALTAGRENLGILAVGAQGSGKTQFLLPILQQVCTAIQDAEEDKSYRAVIFDFKGEYTEVLPVDDDHFALIAPWDQRSAHWDIASDVSTRGDARLIAEQLISDSKDPMWSNASRQVLTGLISALAITKPGRWDFPDLADLVSGGGRALLEALAIGNREAVPLISNPDENKTAQSILANLSAFMAPISDLAEAWRAQPGAQTVIPFSIQRWLADDWDGPRILILQGSSRYEPLMQAFLRSFLGVLIARMIDPSFPEARSRDTDYRLYFFLDEFIRLGKLPDIEKLITVGRSKGGRLLLGLQDIAQVRNVYGPELAAAWFSQLATQFYGRVAPGDTATWLSSVFARREVEHTVYTASKSQGGFSETIGWRPLEEPVLMPGQLASDLGASPNGVVGLLHCTGWGHLYRLHWPITQLSKRREAAVPAEWTQPHSFSEQLSKRLKPATPETQTAPSGSAAKLGSHKRRQPVKKTAAATPDVNDERLLAALRDIVQPDRLNGATKDRNTLGWHVRNDILLVGRVIAHRLRNHALMKDTPVALQDNATLYDWLLESGVTKPSPANGKPVGKARFDDDIEAVIRIPLQRLWPALNTVPPQFTGQFHWVPGEDSRVTPSEPAFTESED